MTYDQLLEETKKLPNDKKAKLALELCGGRFELDKFKQLVVHTNLKWDDKESEYREMKKEDFVEAEDELDL